MTRARRPVPTTQRPVIPSGAVVVWHQHNRSRRATVIAYVPAGTPPVELEPAIRGLNRRRIQFRDPCRPRMRGHYLLARSEDRPKVGTVLIYYLPEVERVELVRGAA